MKYLLLILPLLLTGCSDDPCQRQSWIISNALAKGGGGGGHASGHSSGAHSSESVGHASEHSSGEHEPNSTYVPRPTFPHNSKGC